MATERKQIKKRPASKPVILDDYFDSVRRPMYALCFLLPFIILYEIGTVLVNTDQISHVQTQVAAFTWIMGLAGLGGANQGVAGAFPCIVVIIITLVLQMTSNFPWRVRPAWLCWMAFESMLLTIPLFFIGLVMNGSNSFAASELANDYYARIVIGIGAGIYEELVFRLVLLGLLLMFFDNILKFGHATSIVTATILSALLFSAHHYFGIDMAGRFIHLEPLELGSFLFRMAAGVYFAIVFHYRGYGITAGTHACYNVFYFSFFA